MVVQLLKKDFLIAKNYIIVLMIVLAGLQAVTLFSSDNQESIVMQAFALLISTMFGILVIFNFLSQNDLKYSKATSLLCTAPYTRSAFVKAKYFSLIIIFIYSLIVNVIVNLIIYGEVLLSVPVILSILLINIIVFGIYLPVEFKYGYVKTKFFFIILILFVAFVPQLLVGFVDQNKIEPIFEFIDKITQIPTIVQSLILILISVIVFLLSMSKSTKIFEKKDL